jgi:protein SCO1/2
VIEHEEIPGLMPSMTMSFDVADPGQLDRIRVGQEVDFHLEVSESRYRIVAIAPHGTPTTNPGAQSAPPSPSSLGADDPAPDFRLVDQDGRPVALGDLRGQALVLDFVFTSCPGPCPILTSSHVALQRRLTPEQRERTRFVSISLDPERDTPEALKRYGEARGADLAGWSFLTGPKEDVERVVKAYGVGTIRKPDGNIEHVVATFLIDGRGQIVRRYLGLEHEPAEIQRDLSRALGGAG